MTNETKKMKKFDKSEGRTREVDLTVEKLITSLIRIGVNVKGRKEELVKLCKNNNLPLKKTEEIIEEGWYSKPKGSLQLLWERGWIDPNKSHTYTRA